MAVIQPNYESEYLSADSEFQHQLVAHDEYVQTLTDEDLEKLLNDTLNANEVLLAETEMFEKYLKRVDPNNTTQAMTARSKPAAVGSVLTLSSSQSDAALGGGTSVYATSSVSRMSRRSRSKSRSSAVERLLKLSPEQKCDIAQREIEEYQEEMKRINESSNQILDNLQAIAEEADARMSEIKKEQYEFEKELQNMGSRKKKSMPSAEKVVRFVEDRLRDRESLIVKLRLKNTALKIMKRKLQMQLKQKEEMGEVLHEIDFSQLKIENQQYIERIDERNRELLQLKLLSGNTTTVLNAHKKRLNQFLEEAERLKADTAARHDLLRRLEIEAKHVEMEKKAAEEVNEKLQAQLLDYKVPEVLDYVREKDKYDQLSKQIKTWQRKVNIAEMELSNQSVKLRKLNSISLEPKRNTILPPIKM